jgi:tRNA (cytidine/uridine-2'-O-)-methyltransferase
MQPLLHVVLDRPAIAGNIGACVRLVAATDCALHVCGSDVKADDREMWRAGLDYWPHAQVHFHHSLEDCLTLLQKAVYVVEVGGKIAPWDAPFARGDVVILGPEKGSVQQSVQDANHERILTLPMVAGRSLNLSQVAAVTVFEAVRQAQRRGE